MKFPARSGFFALLLLAVPLAAKQPGDFPRLFGMNIGKKLYDEPAYQAALAKLDVVILGFYPGWNPRNVADPIGSVLHNLRRLNPAIKIGQYTILNESYADPSIAGNADITAVLNRNHWWALDAAGRKVQWTSQYRTWETNNTSWAPTDEKGGRYAEWLAVRNDREFFRPHPEFDIWYVDNVMWRPRVTADWDLDGKNDDRNDPRIQAAYRAGMARYWAAIRRLEPARVIMGNTDSDLSTPEFRQHLDAGFIEGWMGKAWSIEQQKNWTAAIALYRATLANLPRGAILGINVTGASNDYRFFRYAFTSCLMDDGYFSFADRTAVYSSVVWFDEYDAALGHARTSPPLAAWQNGVWRRDFEGGVAVVNPADQPATVVLEHGFHKLLGKQDPGVNNGQPVVSVTLGAKDGLVLLRDR